MRGTLVIALDRMGSVQTARWSDAVKFGWALECRDDRLLTNEVNAYRNGRHSKRRADVKKEPLAEHLAARCVSQEEKVHEKGQER